MISNSLIRNFPSQCEFQTLSSLSHCLVLDEGHQEGPGFDSRMDLFELITFTLFDPTYFMISNHKQNFVRCIFFIIRFIEYKNRNIQLALCFKSLTVDGRVGCLMI